MTTYIPLAGCEEQEIDDALIDCGSADSADMDHAYDQENPFGSAAAIKNLIHGSIHTDNTRCLSGTSASLGSINNDGDASASMTRMTTSSIAPSTGKSPRDAAASSSGAAAGVHCLSFFTFCHACSGVEATDTPQEARTKAAATAAEATAAITCCYWFERIIHNKFCNFIFRCNCTWTWAGGWDDCNVHNTVGAPKCPWCTARANVSWTTDSLLFVLMALTFVLCLYRRAKPQSRLDRFANVALRWAAPVLVYFLAGTFVGWIFKATGSYPTFIF